MRQRQASAGALGRFVAGSYTPGMLPATLYVNVDGSDVAYQVLEPQNPAAAHLDLVFMTGSTSHVDVRWRSPQSARFLHFLTTFSRVIAFDRRGSGASDRPAQDRPLMWEEWAEDLRSVLDAVGSESAGIIATLDGGPTAIMFAATFPERTRALVLANSSARYMAAPDYPIGLSSDATEAIADAMAAGWGTEAFATAVSPSLDPEELTALAQLMRASYTPRAAAEMYRILTMTDVRGALPLVQAPTLVMQATHSQIAPMDQGRYLAEHIPGSRFMAIDSADAGIPRMSGKAVWSALEQFMTGSSQAPDPDRMLATVAFTDIIDSTGHAVALGDDAWRHLLERHHELTRQTVARYGGRTWQATGDGALTTFDAPGRAIRCLLDLRGTLREMGLEIRAGVHAGEIEVRDSSISGLSIHIAARVLDAARDGGVLVSRTVADLVAGSGLHLTDQGARQLRGVPGNWHLYRAESAG